MTTLKNFVFISRHTPTADQLALASKAGIALLHVGDRDAFTLNAKEFAPDETISGMIVVHPAAAMKFLAADYHVGIFENANRAPEGQKPTFEAVRLHLFSAAEGGELFQLEQSTFDKAGEMI